MSADWFVKKKEQLRQMGKHPVPGSIAKTKTLQNPMSRGQIMLRKAQKDNVINRIEKTVDNREDDNSVNHLREKSWNDIVAEAGGLLVVSAGNIGEKCDDQNSSSEEDSPGGTLVDQDGQIDVELSSHSSVDNSCQVRKKKTPLQYRKENPKNRVKEKISMSNKKMFKEAWNTDKSRLEKRQVKYNRPQNFLLILEDNVHEAGHDNSATTAGKYMVFV